MRQKYTNCSLNSGGAKGPVYVGNIKAFYDLGIHNDFEKLSGSSAGAITTALLSISIDFDLLYQFFLETDYRALLGNFVGSFRRFMDGTTEGIPL